MTFNSFFVTVLGLSAATIATLTAISFAQRYQREQDIDALVRRLVTGGGAVTLALGAPAAAPAITTEPQTAMNGTVVSFP